MKCIEGYEKDGETLQAVNTTLAKIRESKRKMSEV